MGRVVLRFAGILTGSAIAIVLIVMTIGTPRLTAADKIPAASEVAAPANPPVELPAPDSAGPPEIVASGTDTGVDDGGAAQPAPPPQRTMPETLPRETALAVPQSESNPRPVEPANWYAFWSPFRSEIAADGFVARLQQTTGMDYRVVKLEPGVYEVAFAYTDDSDRAEKLQRISTATGLDLSGG